MVAGGFSGKTTALTERLCCPTCKETLMWHADSLRCDSCEVDYPIIEGIPVLVDPRTVDKHIQQQISYFERETSHRGEYRLDVWKRRYVERFLESFPSFDQGLVVDCGTGSGYMLVELAKLGFDCIGCDITLSSLLHLKEQISGIELAGEVLLVCCDAQELPLEDGIADCVVSIFLLEHLTRDDLAAREIERVCKQDACTFVSVPLKYRRLIPIFVPLHYVHDKLIGHLRQYDDDTLAGLFPGWELVNKYYVGHFKKTVKVLANIIAKVFSEERIEADDRKKQHLRYGANNLAYAMKRQHSEVAKGK